MTSAAPVSPRRVLGPAILLGVALSGFFDGILLHQILQWHHLLSLVEDSPFDQLHAQILADGAFHALMYLVAAAGLVLLWRARAALARPGAGAILAGGLLAGFGSWNIVDVGLFHWIIGIHRVRVDVSDPLPYDLFWFVGFGLLFLIAGLMVMRRAARLRGGTVALVAVATLIVAIPWANMPARDGSTVVLLSPRADTGAAINAVTGAGGSMILAEPGGSLLVAKLPADAPSLPLYRAGALFVTRSPAAIGCLAFTRRV